MPADALTPKQVADRYGIRVPVVLAWIRTGQLAALNVARSPQAKRPTWRVTTASLVAFELARTGSPVVPATRRRKRQQAAGVIEFY